MAKFVLAYTGGSSMEGSSPEEQQKVMEEWMNWFGSLGEAVADGGAPFGPSSTISPDGKVREGGVAALTGYSIITADSLHEATSAAKGCPVLSAGGSVDVYEALPIG